VKEVSLNYSVAQIIQAVKTPGEYFDIMTLSIHLAYSKIERRTAWIYINPGSFSAVGNGDRTRMMLGSPPTLSLT
jgi:hypothetical protein